MKVWPWLVGGGGVIVAAWWLKVQAVRGYANAHPELQVPVYRDDPGSGLPIATSHTVTFTPTAALAAKFGPRLPDMYDETSDRWVFASGPQAGSAPAGIRWWI